MLQESRGEERLEDYSISVAWLWNRCRVLFSLSLPHLFCSMIVLRCHPFLVCVLFTDPSLLALNFYRKFFTSSIHIHAYVSTYVYTYIHTDRQIEKTDRQTEKTDRQTDTQIDRETKGQTDWETKGEQDRERYRQSWEIPGQKIGHISVCFVKTWGKKSSTKKNYK